MKSTSLALPTMFGQDKKGSSERWRLYLWAILFLLTTAAQAQNYSISTVGNVITITDLANNSDVLLVNESGGNITFNVTVNVRTYSLNGGATTNMPVSLPLTSVTAITINTKGGNDNINFGPFTLNTLPNLTVNGGTGNDVVSFFDDITFKPGASLNVDLQDDDAPVGTDYMEILANANILLSGSGTATVKVSKNVIVNAGGSLVTENGALVVEANQQGVATTGSFSGVNVDRGLLQATGTGDVTVKGKGGTGSAFNAGVSVNGPNGKITSTGGNVNVTGNAGGASSTFADFGVAVQGSGLISTGGNGTVTVTGFGGTASTGANNGGVLVNTGGAIASNNGNTTVTGTGGGTGSASSGNYGVALIAASSIYATGTGAVTVMGTGGVNAGANDNYGVYVYNANSKITSSGGNVSVTGQGKGSGSASNYNYGVHVDDAGLISAGGTGTVTVMGTGGTPSGNFNYGVYVQKANSKINSSGGNVSVTGQGGGSGSSNTNTGVNIETSGVITAGGSGTVTVNGTGGSSTGNANFGVAVSSGNTGITSSGGNVSVTGTGGGTGASSNNVGVAVTSSTISPGGTGTLTVMGTGGPSGGLCYGVWVNGATAIITSGNGNVSVTGNAGGSGSGTSNIGVLVETGAAITAGAAATVTVNGMGGATSGGNNFGVAIRSANSKITSSGGAVNVTGTGGGASNSALNYGVSVETQGTITSGGTGLVTVMGTGGVGTGVFNAGVSVAGGGSTITSAGGNVQVTGNGGGTGASFASIGVSVQQGGLITVGGSGTLGVTGNGGTTVTGVNNAGVVVNTMGSITSNNGNITVTGQGGGSSSSAGNYGVYVSMVSFITAGGTGTVNVQGTGGAAGGNDNYGVFVENANSKISSNNGNVSVIGQGGGTGVSSQYNYGVYVRNAGLISAGGTSSTVTIQGTGGATGGNFNYGVFVENPSSTITSSGGNVSVTGQGGGTGSSTNNMGVFVDATGTITAGLNGTVTINGTGGLSGGNFNVGVFSGGNATISSSGGNVSVTGMGGGSGTSSNNLGVYVFGAGIISAGVNGTVTVNGTGGTTGGTDYGVSVYGTNSRITSSGGTVSVVGAGGGAAGFGNNHGVIAEMAGSIGSGGTATVSVQGTGGAPGGASNFGVYLKDAGTTVTSSGGNVSVTGIEGGGIGIFTSTNSSITTLANGGNITLIANSIELGATSSVSTNAGSSTTIRPYTNNVQIDLGTAMNPIGGPLGLSDAELDLITTGTLNIGNANTSHIAVSANITRPASTVINLTSGASINFNASALNSAGGNVNLVAPGGVNPTAAGVDVSMSSSGTLDFTAGDDLNIVINGTTVDVQYTQLNVVGMVDITGVDLWLTGSPALAVGQTFIIVNNDGTDAITGTFTNLPEGTTLVNFLGTNFNATISYVGGTGNDAVITVVCSMPEFSVCPGTQTANTDALLCTAVVNYTATATGDPTPTLSYTFTGATMASGSGTGSGSTFNKGTTTVTITATNLCNSVTCMFNVVVTDAQAPIVICPGATTINTDAGASCSITIPDYVGMIGPGDNCPGPIAEAQSIPPGPYSTGVSDGAVITVYYTATDVSNNTRTCTINITVNDNDAPTFTCPTPSLILNTNGATNCSVTIPDLVAMVIDEADNCALKTVDPVTQSIPAGTYNGVSDGSTIPVVVTVTDNATPANSTSCTITFTVNDDDAPTFTCPTPPLVLNTTGGANCSVIIPDLVAMVTDEADNCALKAVDPVTQSIVAGAYSGVSDGNTIPVVVTVTDNATPANSTSCTVTFTVNDDDAPTFTCPTPSLILNTNGATNCSVTIPDLVAMVTDEADNCALRTLDPVTQSIPAGAYGGVSDGNTIPVIVTVTDNASPANSTTCTITFTVNDDDAPTFTCPPSTVLNTTGPNCSVTIPDLVAMVTDEADNCALKTINPVTQSVPPGPYSAANGQPIMVMVTVTDNATPANSTTCTVTFTVSDDDPPSIVCPSNISRNTDPNQCSAVVTYASPMFSDNCSGASIVRTSGLASGSAFPKGVNMVNWKATDAAGNTAICGFTVTVTDNQAPTITCPASLSKTTDVNVCTAVVTYVTPQMTDNCIPVGSVLLVSGPASGSTFPKGATVVTWKATDGAGLTKTCSFTVTVNDGQAPAITCPANQAQSTDPGLCTAVVTYAAPTASDNCAPSPTVTIQSGLPSGGTFPKGQTTVIWKATDGAGLTKTCTFRISVNDTQAPTISCPANQSKTTDPGMCTAVTTYAMATVTDNCTGSTVVKLSGPNTGIAFPQGMSQVVFKATDGSGNQSLCTMTVTVTDNQLPVITCPSNIMVTGTTQSGICSATVVYPNPTATDNCGILSNYLMSGLASYSVFPQGVTTNVWKATDNQGFTATCAFTVTVNCGTSAQGTMNDERATMNYEHLERSSFLVPRLSFELAPNPATTQVQVTVAGLSEKEGMLAVFDAQGRLLWKQSLTVEQEKTVIDLDDRWQNGLYFVMLQSGGQTVTKRLVVHRL